MKIALLVCFSVVVLALIANFLLFPRDTLPLPTVTPSELIRRPDRSGEPVLAVQMRILWLPGLATEKREWPPRPAGTQSTRAFDFFGGEALPCRPALRSGGL